jgi:glycosyltransferase involved in cell wall biosynthesis
VSETELESLYRIASCLVLPSLHEGFGLPVLEAMIRGVPVACSDRWALPETAGSAALFFDPQDPVAVAQAMRRLITDQELANDLIERGQRRAATFTWQRTARMTAACYGRALSEYHGAAD